MKPQKQMKFSKLFLIQMAMGVAIFWFVFGSLSWGHGEGSAHGDPVLTNCGNCGTQPLKEGKKIAKPSNDLEFSLFTSGKGDYRYEVPKKWTNPQTLHDPDFEAIFVGPIDMIHHQSVFITVGRYPHGRQVASLNSVLSQLQEEHGKRILETQTLLIDGQPARILRIQEQVPIPMGIQQKVGQVAICEHLALIESGGEVYALEYVSSSKLFEKYRPVFEHMVNSFHFTSGKTKK